MLPLAVNVPVARSYNSELVKYVLLSFDPPTIRTLPLFNSDALCENRGLIMLPVGVKVPLAGSYNSAVARPAELLVPPAIRTFPFGSNVAVCSSRGLDMLPVGVKIPVEGS